MHKIALSSLPSKLFFSLLYFSLFSLPIFAGFFPSPVHTSVQSLDGSSIALKSKFPIDGMSGVVIHPYENGLTAITARMVQTSSDGKASLIDADIIHHDELPTIKTPVKKGDKVIGGYLYNNLLLLAPDADTYAKITKSHNKKWVHPDLYAVFLSVEGDGKPTRENLLHFANKHQIGLVYIVRKDSAILLDPISGKIISQKSMSNLPSQGQFPFYMRLGKLESGWFSSEVTGDYYHAMAQF